jgi:hypothetical protein
MSNQTKKQDIACFLHALFRCVHYPVTGKDERFPTNFNGRGMLRKLREHHFPLVEFLRVVKPCVRSSGQANHMDAIFLSFDHKKILVPVHVIRQTASSSPSRTSGWLSCQHSAASLSAAGLLFLQTLHPYRCPGDLPVRGLHYRRQGPLSRYHCTS